MYLKYSTEGGEISKMRSERRFYSIRAIYCQRVSAEWISARPKHSALSIHMGITAPQWNDLTALIYLLINVKA
jgi:hypothetical protein